MSAASPHTPSAMRIPKRGPWNRPGVSYHYFYGGDLSSFAGTRGLYLPEAWYGHPTQAPLVVVPTIEHWWQAIKGTNPDDFHWILSARGAAEAKRRGGPRGEAGRIVELRPDWERVKVAAMRYGHGKKHAMPRYRHVLPATGDRVLVEDSPHDFNWGGRDARGGYEGRNLLGIVLMEVRAQMLA